jgi:predicted ATPase/class 3 adenylate cyclase
MIEPPTGTISFLFTDIVGSTRLWEKFPKEMGPALGRHDTIVRSAAESSGGYVFKTVGDAFCVAFPTPLHAVQAAIEAQRGLDAENWGEVGRVSSRMGIHTGAAEHRDGDYFGGTLNRASRIEAAAHGGQVLLSQISFELLEDEKPEEIAFKSLGSHRLRNLDRPEHLFQVIAAGIEEAFPAPRSMEVLPNNLPVQTTSFVGRGREIIEVQERLEKNRLITLMGTGGTGKTRLALEVGASQINEFREGVWLVELAPVTDPDFVVAALALAVDVREESGHTLRETVVRFLKEKNVLLILDNCEHLLDTVAPLCAELLRVCPRLKIIAASRHSLGIRGETTYPVPPLGMFDVRVEELTGPDIAEQLSQYDAVRLFIERAIAVRPDFIVTNANAPALAEVCSRLDGIPLAIELAAARVSVLDIEQIAARLGDRFRLLRSNAHGGHLPHQQTLQALIDWSYDLLSDPERTLFRRLGIFVGGRTLDALEIICSGDGLEEFEILDLVQQLADKSLVTVEHASGQTPRYTIIESVWQYAREKLETSGEGDALRDRHLEYFLRFAEETAPHLERQDQKQWLDRCQNDRFNFRAALAWAIRSKKAEIGFRIFFSIYRAIEIRGNLEESRELIAELLALPQEDVSARCRADFLLAAGRLAWAADRYQECRAFHRQAQEIYQSIDYEVGSGLCEMLTGFLDRGDGDLAASEEHFRRGLEIGRSRSDATYLAAGCLSGLGSIALDRGDLDTARQLKEESLLLYEKLGDLWIIGLILWGIVQVCIAQRDDARAKSALEQWGRTTRDLGNRWMLPYILECHASLAISAGRYEHAAMVFGAAEAASEFSATEFSLSEQALHESSLAALKASLPEKNLQVAWELGRRTPPWDVVEAA